MFRYLFVVLLLVSRQATAAPAQQDDVKDALAHAEVLYYEARFQDAIQVLSRIDTVLRPEENRLTEKTSVKLQLALAHIGLNEVNDAKQFLRELYELDPDRHLDPLEFSPKVIALADEAKAEEGQNRCQKIYGEAQIKLAAENFSDFLVILRSQSPACSGLHDLEPQAADLVYKDGLGSYKRGEFPAARRQFQLALQLAPKHEMAAQYIELVDGKMQMGIERQFLDWQKRFDAREFDQASAIYHQLSSQSASGTGGMVSQIRDEYRNSLSTQVERWKLACTSRDVARMDSIRSYVSQMLPDPNFGEDVQAQMTCAAPAPAPADECLHIDHQLAMARLTSRVNPEFNPAVRSTALRSEQRVRVAIHVDAKGKVTIDDVQGTNPIVSEAVKSAVSRWRFSPTIDASGARCVQTAIPFVIHANP